MCAAPAAHAQAPSPFNVSAALETRDGAAVVRVALKIPAGHFIYADHFKVEAADGVSLVPLNLPEPAVIFDKFSEAEKEVVNKDFEALYKAETGVGRFTVRVSFQGCSETVCFFPETKTFELGGAAGTPGAIPGPKGPGAAPETPAGPSSWLDEASHFRVSAAETGYLGKDGFLSFLDRGAARRERSSPRAAGKSADTPSAGTSGRFGLLATIVGILIGGLGLNLTPCVLPLIPINLAIIGAGARAGSRRRGFALGAVYGGGIALVYGLLGLVAVLTGSKFGALNSSPWFNLIIAVVFVLLALAVFDVIAIDFTRFQGRGPSGGGKKGLYPAALILGAVSALLAGACVAPVVISVLLLAGNLYSKGAVVGLLLPFLLGLGMALPWPFAGAGLSVLPKPGRWMTGVKYAFGVLILVMAVYYGHLAYQLFRVRGAAGTGASARPSDTLLAEGFARARAEGKPVFIDFWATWCKNCLAMDKTTFKDPDVQKRLQDFVVVKYQAELPNESPAREVLDHFGALGLPTYVILLPEGVGVQ
ncbi:MAG: cytochrome c biogenesis protein CcdA [Verrucomicrobiota bacterium]